MPANTLSKFVDNKTPFRLDKSHRLAYEHLQKDINGKEVHHQAEERVGYDLEQKRQ